MEVTHLQESVLVVIQQEAQQLLETEEAEGVEEAEETVEPHVDAEPEGDAEPEADAASAEPAEEEPSDAALQE